MNVETLLYRNTLCNLPAILLVAGGLVFVLSSWRRHPPAARWALAAVIWILITYFLAICWYSFGFMILIQNNILPDDTLAITMLLSCCEGVGYVLLLIAFNTARTPYRPPHYYEYTFDDDDHPRISR